MIYTFIAIEDEMRRHFESLLGLGRIHLYDALCESGMKTPEWWFNVLLTERVPLHVSFLDQ